MRSPLIAVVAVAAVAGIAGAGYLIGSRQAAALPPAQDVVQAVANALAPQAPAVTPAAMAETPMAQAPMTPAPAGQSVLSDEQQREVEAIIRNYLIANPEIVRDAIYELQRKEDAAAKVAQVTTITENSPRLFSSINDVVFGNPDGDVTLVEFFDYNCGYCRRAQADMAQLLADDPNLRVVMKEFPILGPGSVEAAQISAAVQLLAPEKYREFHDALLGEPGQVDGARALAVAEDLGLDTEALKTESKSSNVQLIINESHELAGLLQLTGTPSYVTAREVVVGAVGVDGLKASIQKARDCAADQANC